MFEEQRKNMKLPDKLLYRKTKIALNTQTRENPIPQSDRVKMLRVILEYENNGQLSERSKMLCSVDLERWLDFKSDIIGL